MDKFTKWELRMLIEIEWKLFQKNERACQLIVTIQVEKYIHATVKKPHFFWSITQIVLKSMLKMARFKDKNIFKVLDYKEMDGKPAWVLFI